MKPISVLVTAALVIAAACQVDGQSPDASPAAQDARIALTGRNENFLVKLTSSMSTQSSKPGDPVTGVVIDPVPLRGGRVTGTVDRADRSFLDFSFHTLHFDDTTYPIQSVVTSLVNSKGNAGRDDLDQRIRFVGGGLIAYGTSSAVDEGAEVRFVAWEDASPPVIDQ
ncbi:MAG: hypothetical protein WB812_10625 [Woeseiaceae bacterium]